MDDSGIHNMFMMSGLTTIIGLICVVAWRRGLIIGSIPNSVEPDESLKDKNQVSCLL